MIASRLPIFAVVAMISARSSTLAFAPTQSFSSHTKCLTSSATRANNNLLEIPNKSKKSIQNVFFTSERAHMHVMAISSDDQEEGEGETKRTVNEEIFWAKQRALAAQMTAKSDAGVRQENNDIFAKRRLALTSDTFYFSILITSVLWLVSPNPFVPISYIFGALSGTAYSFGLGKFVETVGGSIDDVDVEGAGVGQARFAFLILLFVVVGKFRSQGLLEIPSIMGFFTYQLASLGQGMREIDD